MHTVQDIGRLKRNKTTRSQNGYALLLVVFFVTLLVITLAAAKPNLITQDRREKEEEMIWRGRQYVRGIRLYYQKMHHFPTELDDLYEPKTGIRFMRHQYKDPMNKADGSWRLIYLGPSGQIIGSLNPQPVVIANNTPTAAAPADPLAPVSYSPGDPLGNSTSAGPGSALGGPQNSQSSGGPQATGQSLDSSAPMTPNGIIGVGSKIDKVSIAWFQKQKNYQHFEFIWKVDVADPATITPNP